MSPIFVAVAACVLAADPTATLVGRFAVAQGNTRLSLPKVKKLVHAEKLVLELRHGRRVVAAALDDNGFFHVEAPGGQYTLEYVLVGERPEFFAPQVFDLVAGERRCAGTLELSVGDVETMLGANVKNSFTQTDDCRAIGGRAAVYAPAAPPVVPPEVYSALGYSLGWRVGATLGDAAAGWRTAYAFGLPLRPIGYGGWMGIVTFGALAEIRDTLEFYPPSFYDVTAAVGYHFSWWEVTAGGGARLGGPDRGPFLAAGGRVGGVGAGLSVQVDVSNETRASIMLDLSPVYLLGYLL